MNTDIATIFTDCSGTKCDALKRLFRSRFNHVFVEKFETVFQASAFSFDSLFTTCTKRLAVLVDEFPKAEPIWYATIQKGFYEMNGTWFLCGVAGIRKPNGVFLYNPLGSVPLPETVSEAMYIKPEKVYTAMKIAFPTFNRAIDSYYEIITEEKELDWLLAGLRPLLKTLIEFY